MAEVQKKNKKKNGIVLGLFFLVAALAGAVFYSYDTKAKAEVETKEEVLLENQEKVSGRISFIAGNDIVLDTEDGSDVEYRIPVGTPVETKLGTITTFSRLGEGDQVSMTVQTDQEEKVVMKIRIEEK